MHIKETRPCYELTREVAEMIGKPNDQLMRSIITYVKALEKSDNSKLSTPNFFIQISL